MKQRKIGVLLLLLVIELLASCRMNTDDTLDKTEDLMPMSDKFEEIDIKEVKNVRREFCKVVSLQEDNFTIENIIHELYCIDNSFLENFKVGDNVLLIYHDRTISDEGVYSADVYAVYPDNDKLMPNDN